MIRDIQLFWDGLPKKKISLVCREYGIARHTAEKYVSMTDDEINGMDAPRDYKTRERATPGSILFPQMSYSCYFNHLSTLIFLRTQHFNQCLQPHLAHILLPGFRIPSSH